MQMMTLANQILGEFRRRHDVYMFEAFEKHGYSKEWIMNPENFKRVKVTEASSVGSTNQQRIYSVDDLALFTVTSSLEFDFEESKVNMSFDVKHHA